MGNSHQLFRVAGSITTEMLADDAVTADKLAPYDRRTDIAPPYFMDSAVVADSFTYTPDRAIPVNAAGGNLGCTFSFLPIGAILNRVRIFIVSANAAAQTWCQIINHAGMAGIAGGYNTLHDFGLIAMPLGVNILDQTLATPYTVGDTTPAGLRLIFACAAANTDLILQGASVYWTY